MIAKIFKIVESLARVENPYHRPAARVAAFVAAATLGAATFAAEPAAKFEVFPQDVQLFTARSEQSLVCRVVQPDGVTRDVTDDVQYVTPDNLIKMDHNVARPVGDGAGELKI